MSTAPAAVEDADAADVAAALRDAPFVRIVAAADGDALAASGVLVRACRDCSIPFQVRVDPVPDPVAIDGEDADVVVGLGPGATGGDLALTGGDRPASLTAAEAVRELGVAPDSILALAGVTAADHPVGGASTLLDAAGERIERRPGLAVPTADLEDGLAHSTLVHAPVSGDPEAARAVLAELDFPAEPSEKDHRRVASWLAVEATASSARAAEAVERALRPHATPDGRFATVEGFGDVLDAAAREQPGTGVALAIRNEAAPRTATLAAWRTHAEAVHTALADATTGRYDGVFVARVDGGDPGRLGTVARLCRDFQSPEPVVLVVAGDGRAAAATRTAGVDSNLGRTMRDAVRAVDADGRSAGDARRATARFEDAEVSRLITAFREAL
ncbi:MAG: exonuclease RecJ [Haloplanus sp.]